MLHIIKKIEKRNRAFKKELQALAENASENSIEIEHLRKWINSDDSKLIATSTSFIDELGSVKPELCTEFTDKLFELLDAKRNRIVWGSLTALESYAELILDTLFSNLDKIIKSAEIDSIVAKDHAMKIYKKLASNDEYYNDVIELMLEQVRICPDNQLGQYAELTLSILKIDQKNELLEALRLRIVALENPHHLRRAESVLEQVRNMK